MTQPFQIGDRTSALFNGLSGFWTRFWRDTADLQAFYLAAEIYIGQAYLDMLSDVLNTGIVDMPVFNKEYWQLFPVREDELDFVEGASVAEDRYRYDMPGDARTTDFLQSTILDPVVLYERDVDFFVENEDGYIRFISDPFRDYQDPVDGAILPKPGLGWRMLDILVGNQFRDVERNSDWRDDSEVKAGDTLRLLAQAIDIRVEDITGTGQVFYGGGAYRFYSANPDLQALAYPGDVLQVKDSGTIYDGYYIIKEIPGVPGYVELEQTFYTPLSTSPANLNWRIYKMSYFDTFVQDYSISYIEVQYLIGNQDTAFPLDLKEPLVYAVVRDVAEPDVLGFPVSPTVPTFLGYTHIIPGSLDIHALRDDGEGKIREGEDYTVNYLTGWLYPIAVPPGHWDPASLNTCDFKYRRELVKSAGGSIAERTEGRVKQLAFWVPEVTTDRFNLYYHYGYLLNRFEASSETYKSFLRGIMHLYMHGPIFERMVSGMNVVAGYPVIGSEGEKLTGYFNGIDAQSATDGQIFGATKRFTTSALTYTFSALDIGGYIIFPNPASPFNKGKFRILSLVDSQTVELESSYPMVDEAPVEWILSRNYQKVVTTDQDTYKFPFFVPMRADVEDPANFNTLSFSAFEALTTAFTVTDYIEAPTWWIGKTIPHIFFPTANLLRRVASDGLFQHIYDPDDVAMFDDPGLYYDGDDDGIVTDTPYRHNVGFILFDRFLKFHMFYVAIDPELELPESFKSDFEDIVLITKPAYTYPYVEPSEPFLDEGVLWDLFNIPKISLHWGDLESIEIAPNELTFDSETELAYNDYFRYVDIAGAPLPFPLPPGPFPLPLGPAMRPVVVNIHATVMGVPVLEGLNYWVIYDSTDPLFGRVLPIGPPWDMIPATCDMQCVELVNTSVVPIPDTTIGFTPLIFDGGDPAYVRKDMHAISERTEHVDRPISLHINDGGSAYPYP